jgi:gluconokinase
LAEALGWQFADADQFHSPASIAKMSQGHPLDKADRLPWIRKIATFLKEWTEQGVNGVIACSALRQEHRLILRGNLGDSLKFVYLKGTFQLFEKRLLQRQGHFMKAGMLQSQIADLEEPETALVVDASESVEHIVSQLITYCRDFTR